MQKVIFYSHKPYLHIALHRSRGIFITFDKDCTYTPTNEVQLQLLRDYAEKTKNSFIISESIKPAELRRKYEELEAEDIKNSRERIKAEQEAEKAKKEEHDFYSALRFADQAYR